MLVYEPGKTKLPSLVNVSIKLDGVQAIRTDKGWESRAGKPLYNLPLLVPNGKYEVYLGDFKSSIIAVRTKYHQSLVTSEHLYSIDSKNIDKRIDLGLHPESDLPRLFQRALELDYEGLVIEDNFRQYKMKQKCTYDCRILSAIEGQGRNKGRLGALRVRLGAAVFNVGTGFTDNDREEIWNWPADLEREMPYIEVEAMEVLPSGKLRHPRFLRFREDLS